MTGCLFCDLIAKKANMLFENEKIFVMMLPFSLGNIAILPKKHAPILESVPDYTVAEMFRAAKKASVSLFESIGAFGTNVLIQNGTPAGQSQNHAMLHVIPCFEGDGSQLSLNQKHASNEDLEKAALQISDDAKNVGVFEKEKPKPIEIEAPKEVKKEDLRLRSLERIP